MIWNAIVIILGLIFGSFGSVILTRRGESKTWKQASSILRGRSQCPFCKTTLQAWDLIPVLSFIFQGGRCRYCAKKISWLYPILEIGSALIFFIIWKWYGIQERGIMIFWMLSSWILWLMVVYDILWYEVHIPLLLIVSGILIFAMRRDLFLWGNLQYGILFLGIFLIFYLLAKERVKLKYHVQEEGLGMGDVLMAPYLGTLLFSNLPQNLDTLDKTFVILIFFILSGSIGILWYGIQTIYQNRKAVFLHHKIVNKALPFVPSMILSVVIIICLQKYLFSLFML